MFVFSLDKKANRGYICRALTKEGTYSIGNASGRPAFMRGTFKVMGYLYADEVPNNWLPLDAMPIEDPLLRMFKNGEEVDLGLEYGITTKVAGPPIERGYTITTNVIFHRENNIARWDVDDTPIPLPWPT